MSTWKFEVQLCNYAESGCCSLFVPSFNFFSAKSFLYRLRAHPPLCYWYDFSLLFLFFSLLTSSFAARYCLLANVHGHLSLEGPPGPSINGNNSDDAW